MTARTVLFWAVLLVALVASWLPYFDIVNDRSWVGPLPLPLAWVLASNVVLTICAGLLYPLYFKPLARRLGELEESSRG